MHPDASPRHPFKALVALVAAFAVVHGVCAHADTRDADDAVTSVHGVGQLPLHQDCRGLDDDELADEFTSVRDEVDKPSAVAVTFKVQGGHVFDVAPASDSKRE